MAKQYDADKGEWVAANKEQEAIAKAHEGGGPLRMPGDRTEDDMRRLEPGMAGPVLTTNENTVDMDRAGTGGGAAGARTR